MAIFKAWASRLWAGLDRVVAELEDHDALIESALRELDRAAAKTRAELEGVRADRASLHARLSRERTSIEAWRAAAL